MKARIKEIEVKPTFKPFTLEIDIETIDELKYFLTIINPPISEALERTSKFFNPDKIYNKHATWTKLNEQYLKSMYQQETN